MGKKIVNLPTGSVNDNELAFLGDPLTGELFQISYLQLKTYFQQGIITSTVFNALSSSYSQDSASFLSQIQVNAGKITNVYASESNYLPTASYLVDSGSFVSKIATSQGIITNVFASESNYLPTASYLIDSSSFNSRINTVSSSLSSITGSGVTTGAFNSFTASINSQVSNVFASESNYTPTSSYNALSSSYSTDSGSFNGRIIALSGSLGSLTGSYVTVAPFNAYTGSTNTQILNVYASESNYLLTASFNSATGSFVQQSLFNAFSGSYVGDSSSFNSRINIHTGQINNIIISQSGYLLTSSYFIDSASFNSRIGSGSGGGTSTTSSVLNFIIGDGQSFTPSANSTIFSSSILVNKTVLLLQQEGISIAPISRSVAWYSVTGSIGKINLNNTNFATDAFFQILYT